MRVQKILVAVAIAGFTIMGCKNETTSTSKKTEVVTAKQQMVALNISGMTCEIGCAKTIQAKLSKKEGVLEAKVVFKDSVAKIQFDANKTSKEDLIAFVDGIAGGDLYKATEASE